jgi:exopolyphosphatase/guanosine-5'-triphosphate,3'-diphosphate pyrophosphatase
MRIGIIDLGTNSARFAIHEVTDTLLSKRILFERIPLRLGESVFARRSLCPDACRRTIDAFVSFKAAALASGVSRIVAVATSALRDAANSKRVLQAIRRESGIAVEIISGKEEALLIAQGVLRNEPSVRTPVLIFDMGGGSTEFIYCQDEKAPKVSSLNIGALRLQQMFLRDVRPSSPEPFRSHAVNELRHYLRCMLSKEFVAGGWPLGQRLIGASGTLRSLGRLCKAHGDKGSVISRSTVERIISLMMPLTFEELVQLPGMDPKRADTILAAAAATAEILAVFGVSRTTISRSSLRDGLLDRELEMLAYNEGVALQA